MKVNTLTVQASVACLDEDSFIDCGLLMSEQNAYVEVVKQAHTSIQGAKDSSACRRSSMGLWVSRVTCMHLQQL